MSDSSYKGNRIAINTLVLYLRMFFLMAVSLYTSRVILKTLGIVDFGIYNVVGGFVALFAVVSKSLSSAASRFINIEIGKGEQGRLKQVFSSIVTIQIVLAMVIAFIGETFGLWFVNSQLILPDNRILAANWCYQFSILTFCSNIITIPYNAAIIAHEQMKAFAYVSIFEGLSKLVIAYLILLSPIDHLVFYSLLICLLQLSVQVMYRLYCRFHFKECKYHFYYDKKLLKQIFSFSGWKLIGTSTSVLRNQGGNVLMNMFFGPTVNAARAIANQVLNAINGFVTNYIIAVNPQITQSYASGDRAFMMKLIFASCKFSYFMLFMLSIPIIINIDYILYLWLTKVPEKSSLYTILTIVFALIETISHPLIVAQNATGKQRLYQIVIGSQTLSILPFTFLFYRLGYPPEYFFYTCILTSITSLISRIILLHNNIDLEIKEFIIDVIKPVVIVTVLSPVLPLLVKHYTEDNIVSLGVVLISSFVTTFICIWVLGCKKQEKEMIASKVGIYFKKIIKNKI